jgi:hypothetical protein
MRMIFGVIGGMKIGRGNRSTQRKPTPAPLCPPQNPTWRTRSRTPDRSGGKPATNRLSYGAVFFSPISSPLTTRSVTMEVFDPASTRVCLYVKTVLFIFQNNVSEAGFCLRLQIKPNQLGPIDRASPCLRTGDKDGDRIQSLKRCVLKNKQDGFYIKTRRWIMSKNIIILRCSCTYPQCKYLGGGMT